MSETHPTINPAISRENRELDGLCQLIREEKVILWVGSGFSSYAGYPTGTELPSLLISSNGKLPEGMTKPDLTSLQEAADYYVKKKDRIGLNSFLVETYGKEPLRCDIHESLALINRIKYVVTTNYDLLFERAYGNKIVVVSWDEDLPASTEHPDKTILLKIHGDITKPDTIVITSDDYKKFKSDTIVWSEIRSLLSKYAVVFIGYSLHDPNVKTMLRDINARLKGKRNPFFFISKKIKDSRREDLDQYGLNYIEMDAVVAINYITENAIQYTYLDGMKNPAIFSKSAQIFERKGLRVVRILNGEKVTHISLVPTRPDVHCEIKMTISSKNGDKSPQILAFQKLLTGQSFEPVTLTDSECDISIRDGEMNGIFIFDPSIQSYPQLSVTPQPVEINLADLQLQNTSIRISNLRMKVFKSESLLKFEIEDPDFILKLSIPKGNQSVTLYLSLPHLASDIERGQHIYSLFGRWMHGEAMELLSDRFSIPILLSPPSGSDINPDFPPIHSFCQLYTDLSDIQHILKVRLSIPEEITLEDQRTIRILRSFLRGEKEKLSEIRPTIRFMIDNPDLLTKEESLTLNGPCLVGMRDFNIFGKMLKVPYRIECSDMQFEDVKTVQKQIGQGFREFKVVMKSKTGQLYAFYQPQKIRDAR